MSAAIAIRMPLQSSCNPDWTVLWCLHGGQVRYPYVRGELMGFAAGKSGNPGGRTKEQREREKALAAAIRGLGGENCQAYLARLHEIALGAEAKDSIKAIEVLLTRCIGKPTETIVTDDQAEITDEQYAEECAAIAREYLASLSPDDKLKLLANTAPSATIQ